MKKKFIICILMIFLVQYGFSIIDFNRFQESRAKIIESKPSTEESYEYLVNSKLIGYDYNDIYLGIILKEENSEDLLKKLFNDAQYNAGKINALMGLNYLNSSDYIILKKELSGDVLINEGCYIIPYSAQEYINNYEHNFNKKAIENEQNNNVITEKST